MEWPTLLILSVTCGFICYQDLSTRMVSWFLFPLLAIAGILYSASHSSSWKMIIQHWLINLLFLAIQFLLLKLTYYFRGRGSISLLDHHIGWGDVLFLAACSFFFSPLHFIIFYCTSLVFALVFHLVARSIPAGQKKYDATVPLAGLQALLLVFYILTHYIIGNNLANDEWLISYLTS